MGVWNAIECWFLQRLVLGIRSSVGTLALPLRPLFYYKIPGLMPIKTNLDWKTNKQTNKQTKREDILWSPEGTWTAVVMTK